MIDNHRNPDGTYDGAGVMSEMTGLGRGDVLGILEQVKANNAKLNACPWHEFEQSAQTAPLRSLTHQKYVCRHCGGEIDASAYYWHEQGRRARP